MAGALITLVVGGVIIARRLGGGLAPWAWGGVAFVLSQAARLPALTLISALIIGSAAPESGSATWALSVVVASLTAGIFEEGSRALILSTAAKRVRSEGGGKEPTPNFLKALPGFSLLLIPLTTEFLLKSLPLSNSWEQTFSQ